MAVPIGSIDYMAWEFGNKERVAILIPHTGSVSLEWADRVYGPLKFVPSPHFDKVVLTARGTPWDVARNSLVKQALGDSKVTHLMWIDSDVVFEQIDPNEAILQLMRCDAPIVSGVYRVRQKSGFNYAMWTKHPQGFVPVERFTGNWLTVDVIGFGCVLIKREVFERVPEPWFFWGPGEFPSEDFNFCLRAAEHGYKVYVYTDLKCSHISSGGLKVTSDRSVTTLDV